MHEKDGRWRAVRLRLRRPDLEDVHVRTRGDVHVRTRGGYYAPRATPAAK
jgi:hypothetical protein